MFDISKLDDWCVDNWRQALRWASVRWAALGTLLLPLMQMVPQLPEPIQELLPLSVRVIVNALWCIVFIILRMRAQTGLANGK